MPYFILGLAVAIGLFFIIRGLGGLPRQAVARVVKWILLLFAGTILVLLATRIGVGALLTIGMILLPIFFRWNAIKRMAKRWGGPTPGQSSNIETAYLRMELDHDTGVLSGTVLKGRYRGRFLNEMDEGELMELLRECRVDDPQSAGVLESYLDRVHGAGWRAAAGSAGEGDGGGDSGRQSAGASADGTMTRTEAFEILGLAPGATDEDIKEAHRQLMIKLHPDRGGSTYLAAKINQAKDLLLGH